MVKTERKINIYHLLKEVLSHWILILIVAGVCAVLGAGYAVLKSSVESNIQKEISVTEEEFAGIQMAAEIKDLLEAQTEYNEECIWKKCEGFTKGTASRVYSIYIDNEIIRDKITAIYVNLFEKNDIYAEIVSNAKENIKEKYIKEGIICTVPSEGIFQINVTSYSEEKAVEWMEIIDEYLKEKKEDIQTVIGEKYEIKELSNASMESIDPLLEDTLVDLDEKKQNLQTKYDNMIAALSENQAMYLPLYLLERENVDYVEGTPLLQDTQILQNTKKSLFARRLKIDTILGFLLGGVLVCAFWTFRYCYAKKLVEPEELEEMYHLNILGRFPSRENGVTYEKVLIENCRSIISRISLKLPERSKVYVTGLVKQESIIEGLIREGEKRNIDIVYGTSILEDVDVPGKMNSIDAVLFIVEKKETTYSEIEEEIKICREGKKEILGLVVIQ